jgi:hypothetical protein
MWQDAHNNFIVGQRAWVGIRSPVVLKSFTVGQPVSFETDMYNFGPSPALHAVNWAEVNYDGMDVEKTMQSSCGNAYSLSHGMFAKDMHNPSAGTIISDAPYGQTLFPGMAFPNTFASLDTRKEPYEGNVFIVGCISYRDQFGRERRTRYCAVTPKALKDLPLPAQLANCTTYNDAD